MNYKSIYDALIDRARNRAAPDIKETHHINPRCLGGGDESENLVDLTPEEHFVAHQLLIKIYPDAPKLVSAVLMMTAGHEGKRSNKFYGWLRRRYISECRKRIGEKNPSFGTAWYFNVTLKECRKFSSGEEIPEGWIKGRRFNWDKYQERICSCCSAVFVDYTNAYCSRECATKSASKKNSKAQVVYVIGGKEFYGVKAAADHLGLKPAAIKYHVDKGWITKRSVS